MKLGNWLRENDQTMAAFAARVGVSNASVIAKYVNGHRIPKPEIMRRIEIATGGQVTPNDFFAEAA